MSTPQPPQPPEIQREFTPYPVQVIGIGIMTLLIVAALLGIFGATTDTVQASTRELTLALEYGSRIRYGQPQTLNIAVTNHSDQPLEGAFVRLERDYLAHFSDIQIIPSNVRITDDSYEMLLDPIEAGGARFVMIEMRAERAGMYESVIVLATGEGAALVTVRFSSVTFP
ncbi:MAG: hypothetical protein SF123_00780 [Chloroflexota bacterium]|nr:hypothetical protein [Chloroflexota bacterium]